MPKTNEEMLTPRQAAQLRHVSLTYIYYELWANRVPGAIKIGKKWRLPREVVIEKAQRVQELDSAR